VQGREFHAFHAQDLIVVIKPGAFI